MGGKAMIATGIGANIFPQRAGFLCHVIKEIDGFSHELSLQFVTGQQLNSQVVSNE